MSERVLTTMFIVAALAFVGFVASVAAKNGREAAASERAYARCRAAGGSPVVGTVGGRTGRLCVPPSPAPSLGR